MIINIDESAADRLARCRNLGRAPVGEIPIRSTRVPYIHHSGNRYTFIAAININGFVHRACEVVLRKNELREDTDPDIGTTSNLTVTSGSLLCAYST